MSTKFGNLIKKQLSNNQGLTLDATRIYKAVNPDYNVVSLEGRSNEFYRAVISLENEEKKEADEKEGKTGVWQKIKNFFKKIWEMIKRAFNWVKGLFSRKETKEAAVEADEKVKDGKKPEIEVVESSSSEKSESSESETESKPEPSKSSSSSDTSNSSKKKKKTINHLITTDYSKIRLYLMNLLNLLHLV